MENPRVNLSPPDHSNVTGDGDDEKQTIHDTLIMDKSWSPSPVTNLAMGCDTIESEEWEEELRKIPEDSSPSMSSPIFSGKKQPKRLTYVSKVEPAEVLEESIEDREDHEDLTTPHHSSSAFSLDIPRRPMKERRASSASESGRSCRHLFSPSTISDPHSISSSQDGNLGHKPEQRPKFVQKLNPIPSDSSQGDDQDGALKEGEELEEIRHQPCEEKVHQNERATSRPKICIKDEIFISPGNVEEQCSPALFSLSPSSSSCHCSDCEECISDMTSSFSSPRLSQVKPMSQTIESSDESSLKIDVKVETDIPHHGDSAVTQECTVKPKIELSDIPKCFTGEICSTTTSMPIQIGDLNKVKKLKEENMELETCMTPSSEGSTTFNFTAISGVSPLPTSDPSHHHNHHHHHHKHHHHEHHKHHHEHHKHHHEHHKHHHEHHKHHHCSQESVGARDNIVTSTPINRKKVVDDVDESSITSVPDETMSSLVIPHQSRPRLCTSSELEFPESPTPSPNGVPALLGPGQTAEKETLEASDKENMDPRTIQDDQENVDPTAKTSITSSLVLANLPPMSRDEDGDASKGTKGSGSRGNNSKSSIGEQDITSSLQFFFGDPISGAELLERGRPSPLASRCKRMRNRSPSPKDLTKEEAAYLWETPVNFSDKVWEMLPATRRASSVDESLFRPQADIQDSIFSVTLE
ncbi:hypothetical protein Pcinc_020409 [Petrolisthes cinctipes]|uniref:Uncharacterized protein n=1 Tax=Petrolisthes cinctipes TaxID=88211 RepID=A0AAE1KK02_PETCI|nr:hypothetical protein Pcinc_020409 [Petrolisthes cinctipes]